MRALVVGAGVAGPVAALALQRAGVEVRVVERRPRPEPEGGSWFTLAPNGLDALAAVDALGLAQTIGSPTRFNVMRSARGRRLGRLSLGRPLDDGTPALTMRRGRLAAALAEECGRRGIPVDHAVTHDATGPVDEVDLVVAADGVHSRTRRRLDPGAPAARYVGLVNFGGTTRLDDLDAATRAGLGEPETWQFTFGSRCFWATT